MTLAEKRLKAMRSITKKPEPEPDYGGISFDFDGGISIADGNMAYSFTPDSTGMSRGNFCEACGNDTRHLTYANGHFQCFQCNTKAQRGTPPHLDSQSWGAD
jgi:hypothetical protein